MKKKWCHHLLLVSFLGISFGLHAEKSVNSNFIEEMLLDNPPSVNIHNVPAKADCNPAEFYVKLNAGDSLGRPVKVRVKMDTAKLSVFGLDMRFDGATSPWINIPLTTFLPFIAGDGSGYLYLNAPGLPSSFPMNNDSVFFRTWAMPKTLVDTVSLTFEIVSHWDSTQVISPTSYANTIIYNNIENTVLNFIDFPAEIQANEEVEFAVVMNSGCKFGEPGKIRMSLDTSLLKKVSIDFMYDGGRSPWIPLTREFIDTNAMYGADGFLYISPFPEGYPLNNDTVYFKVKASEDVLAENLNMSFAIVDGADSAVTWSPVYTESVILVNPDTATIETISIGLITVPLNTTGSSDYTLTCSEQDAIIVVTPNNGSTVTINGVAGDTLTVSIPVGTVITVPVKITSKNGTETIIYNLNIKKPFPNTVLVQTFNTTLSVIQNTANNGGFEFTNIQWYKEGIKLIGETESILRGVAQGSSYYAELTTGGNVFSTCPKIPVQVKVKKQLSVYPNPVSVGNVITIETPFADDEIQGIVAELVTLDGVIMYSAKLEAAKTQLKMDISSGIYLLQLRKGGENLASFKITLTK